MINTNWKDSLDLQHKTFQTCIKYKEDHNEEFESLTFGAIEICSVKEWDIFRIKKLIWCITVYDPLNLDQNLNFDFVMVL